MSEGKFALQLNSASASWSLKKRLWGTFLKGFTGLRAKCALGKGREILIWVHREMHKVKGVDIEVTWCNAKFKGTKVTKHLPRPGESSGAQV